MLKRLLILILLLWEGFAQCQPSDAVNLDSLKILLSAEKNTTNRIKILLKIGEAIEETEPNTALYYYNKAFFLLKNEKDSSLLAQTYLDFANTYETKQNIDTSMFYYNKALKLFLRSKDYKNIGSCYNGMGNLFYYKFDLSNALLYYQKSLEMFEKLSGQNLSIANELHNIGLIHDDNKNYLKALEYYKKALKVFKEYHSKGLISNCYNSMASAYMNMKQNDSAIFYYEKAISYASKDIYNKEIIYANLGQVYLEKKNYQKSLAYYVKAESYAKKLNDEIGYADIYQGMGLLFFKTGEYYKSITSLEKSIVYAKKTQSREYLKESYRLLKENYKKTQHYENALTYAELLATIVDSIYNVDKARVIAKTEARYQNKQKQLMINNLEKENAISKEKAKKQMIFLIAVILGFLVVSVFLIFIFRLMKKQKNINKLLSTKTNEILTQRDEIEAQRDLVLSQKEEIQIINNNVGKSIEYAKRIQDAALPIHKNLQEIVDDSFIFFKQRDIVSGDFYWWTKMKVDNILILTVSDCTGHGVPGAFMSLLGISFLREIVIKEYISHPGVILRKLRKEIINALKQKTDFGEQKDGMDMSLISLNLETLELQFAGANNPLYIVKPVIARSKERMTKQSQDKSLLQSKGVVISPNEQITSSCVLVMTDNEFGLYEVKPDKMPIGIYGKMDKFTNHKIQLQKGDQLYLFSDGFADQFGGPKNKKFKYKPFKQLLMDNCQLSMTEQKAALEKTFTAWKADNEQVDDVTVLGIKI